MLSPMKTPNCDITIEVLKIFLIEMYHTQTQKKDLAETWVRVKIFIFFQKGCIFTK